MFSFKSLSLLWLLSIVGSSAGMPEHPAIQRAFRSLDIPKIELANRSCSMVSVRRQMRRFESKRRSTRERARRNLDQLITRCKNRDEILASLTDMTQSTCDRSMVFANIRAQWRFEGMTLSLAKAGYEPAIPILVKCINISTRETGLTMDYWPAQNSLIAYGRNALLPVSELLLHSDEELACSAAGVLSSIGGNEAKAALTNALSESREPISHACVKAALANIR